MATFDSPPPVSTLLRPDLYKKLIDDRDIPTSATLDSDAGLYSFYAAMRVGAELPRARRILTNYSLYSEIVPYVDRTVYSPITRRLELEGGIWKFRVHSLVRFDERSERWIHFEIVGGHFKGLAGDMFFESIGEKGTLVYMRGQQAGRQWPPKFIIERGAEIVFGFTANRMRKYLESGEDRKNKEPNEQKLPQPRSRL